MSVLLTALLVVHGLLHLLGFLKAFGLADIPGLGGRTLFPISGGAVRLVGVLWLLACILFLAAAALRSARQDAWWVLAAVGAVSSQALIVFQWTDAKAGTAVNVVILCAAYVAARSVHFEQGVATEVRSLRDRARASAVPLAVTPDDLGRLPPPVRRWLERSGASMSNRPRVVRLEQRGAIRTSADGPWMPAEAEQYFSVEPPGFVWSVKTTMAHVVPIVGRDKYEAGKGHMLIEAASTLKIADATGPKIDQGALLRFLGEIVWFPSAALAPYIEWKGLDEGRAEATMRYAGVVGTATFSFDGDGRFRSMTGERYMGGGDEARLERWIVPATAWRVVRGVEVPVAGNVVWKLASGDFEYYRWEILDIEYDPGGAAAATSGPAAEIDLPVTNASIAVRPNPP